MRWIAVSTHAGDSQSASRCQLVVCVPSLYSGGQCSSRQRKHVLLTLIAFPTLCIEHATQHAAERSGIMQRGCLAFKWDVSFY